MDLAAREQRLRQIQACGTSVTGKFGWGAGVVALIAVALWSGIGHKAARERTAAVERRYTSSERISATFGRLGPGIASPAQNPASAP